MSAHHVPVGAMIGLGIFVKLFGTIALALLIAYIFAQLAQNRNLYSAFGKPVFTGTDIEELLFVLAAVLIVYVLGNESPVTISNGCVRVHAAGVVSS